MASDDTRLVREYATGGSEQAFETLVNRYAGLVYSAALRQVRNPHLAEEVAQVVFVILARKSHTFGEKTILAGWLYRTTRYAAMAVLKREIRRQRREQEAHMQSTSDAQADSTWEKMFPLLDEAMTHLGNADRDALVLRYFEGRSLSEVGNALGTNEEAARKRVSRALEKLRGIFIRRGVVLSAAAIAGVVAANSVQAAPASLVATLSATAAAGSTATASTLTLVKGALKIMAWTKAKMVIVAGAVVLIAAGTTTVAVKEYQEHRTYPWQTDHPTMDTLEQATPQVRILPAKYPVPRIPGGNVPHGAIYMDKSGKMLGLQQSARTVVKSAYRFANSSRFVFPTNILAGLSENDYDFIASLPRGNAEALQQEVKRKFGVIAKTETRETDVLLLRVRQVNMPGLQPAVKAGGGIRLGHGQLAAANIPLSFLANWLEAYFEIPVIDQTGVTGNFDINLKWNELEEHHHEVDGDPLNQVLLDQLGLEIVPGREPVEMLVVQAVKN